MSISIIRRVLMKLYHIGKVVILAVTNFFFLNYYRFRSVSIVMMDGGLGSQIMKYAFGSCVEKKTGARVYYDTTWFANNRSIDGKDSRKYKIEEVFPVIKIRKASARQIRIIKAHSHFVNKKPHLFSESVFKNIPCYYDGYYVHKNYFLIAENTLRNDLVFSDQIKNYTKEFSSFIKGADNSVAVHVRRGDYVNSVHDVLDSDYYVSAIKRLMQEIRKNLSLFFFSNDLEWVKDNIVPRLPRGVSYIFFTGANDTGYFDMYLMSLCEFFIISNSSFSWIPAWLGSKGNKKIIMPDTWYKTFNDSIEGIDNEGIDNAMFLEKCSILVKVCNT